MTDNAAPGQFKFLVESALRLAQKPGMSPIRMVLGAAKNGTEGRSNETRYFKNLPQYCYSLLGARGVRG